MAVFYLVTVRKEKRQKCIKRGTDALLMMHWRDNQLG